MAASIRTLASSADRGLVSAGACGKGRRRGGIDEVGASRAGMACGRGSRRRAQLILGLRFDRTEGASIRQMETVARQSYHEKSG